MSRLLLLLAVAGALVAAGCLGAGEDLTSDRASDDGPPRADSPPPDRKPGGDAGEYAPGWPEVSEAELRPGVNVADGSCTSSFLFRSPDNRTLYLGTAAHCVTEQEVGDPVKVAQDYVGTLAYSSWKTQEAEEGEVENHANDFALVELPDEARDDVHPAVHGVGGPEGLATDASQGDRVLVHGNSTLRPDAADTVRPREGWVTGRSTWLTSLYLVGPGVPGDSGSAVLDADGNALGVLVHLEFLPEPGSNNAANLDALLDYANEHDERTFELVTWTSFAEPTIPPMTAADGIPD